MYLLTTFIQFPLPPCLTFVITKLISFFVCEFVCLFLTYNWSTILCYFLLYKIVIWYFCTFQNYHHKSITIDSKSIWSITIPRYNYWLHSQYYTFHTPDSLILQLKVCTSLSPSPISLLLPSPLATLWQPPVHSLYLWLCSYLAIFAHLFVFFRFHN